MPGSSRIVKADFRELDKFVKGISEDHVVRVGIFGNKSSRKGDSTITNPEVGAIHEFGSPERNIPARSFLRIPIMKRSAQIIANTIRSSYEFLLKGNMVAFLKRFGIECENAVQEAFDSSGFGQWDPLKDPTRHGKNKDGGARPLIDTGQLRRAITSKVVAK